MKILLIYLLYFAIPLAFFAAGYYTKAVMVKRKKFSLVRVIKKIGR